MSFLHDEDTRVSLKTYHYPMMIWAPKNKNRKQR